MGKIICVIFCSVTLLLAQSCMCGSTGNDSAGNGPDGVVAEELLPVLTDGHSKNPFAGFHIAIIPERTTDDIYNIDWINHHMIFADDDGDFVRYDDEKATDYDACAFNLFCAYRTSQDFLAENEIAINARGEKAALDKWQKAAGQLEPYLGFCFDMPVTDAACDEGIRKMFNKNYYDYKDKKIYLADSGYGFRRYGFVGSNMFFTIYRLEDAGSRYDGALTCF